MFDPMNLDYGDLPGGDEFQDVTGIFAQASEGQSF
jgi:hypothetical protein